MTAERWEKIQELFHLVSACDPARRPACLDQECSGDEELRREVESLLSCERDAHDGLHAAIDGVIGSYARALSGSISVRSGFQGTARFSIQGQLGTGGFGTVYRAYDHAQNTTVALKVLHVADAEMLYGFKREFRALADISHPNLVALYELISDGEQCFFTMELVEGVNFREYARDPVRLRASLKQLVRGVSALHAAGKLHRDIKPSNVLVTMQGHLVILDFGLITDIQAGALHVNEPIAGTPAYMSPEQAAGLPLAETSDWYSVGIMLYEALTGQLPAKHDRAPRPPHELAPEAPRDLSELCAGLLQRDPRMRPSGDQMRVLLGITTADVASVIGRTVRFVGREGHLGALTEAFESAKAGRAAAVFLHGSSGIGKTALAHCFLDRVQQAESVLVLAGRCYEQESLPYKAVDTLIDALSVHLKGLPVSTLEELAPGISALARMFPVLQVLAGDSGRQEHKPADLQEQRRRGFGALCSLFTRLAKRQPIILFIDDLQWGDSDSAKLVAELLRPPAAPPLLLIGCYRTEEANTSPFLQTLFCSKAGIGAAHCQLLVAELARNEAEELAVGLVGAARAESIIRHAGGNPFFIGELARYAESPDSLPHDAAGDAATLGDLVNVRLSLLSEPARRYLELVAVAGQPIDSDIVRLASEPCSDHRAILAVLRAGRLIRTRITNNGHEIETYHDRIRETVSGSLSSIMSRDLHLRLGRALEASAHPRADLLAIHFAGAGHHEALRYADTAGDQAAATLAFDSAARFYRMALEFESGTGDQGRSIRRKLGDALSNAGRGSEAAEAYLGAAALASPTDALEDRRRAAWQYLISGHVDEGRRVIENLLGAIGMRLAKTPRRALISMLLGRARINLRGLDYRERAATQVSKGDLIRIDTCWSVAHGMGFVHTIHAADFHARQILLALRAGEKYRVARALAVEAAYHALAGTRRQERARQALQAAIELSDTCDNPHALALTTLVAGMCAFLEGRWKSAQGLLTGAETVLLERCIGTVWELSTARLMWSASSFLLGELNELGRRLPALLADADARGDLYEATALRTRIAHAGLLAADQPEAALETLRNAIAKWSVRDFHVQHWWSLIAQSEVFLYQGRGSDAWELIRQQWPALRRSLLLRTQYMLIESLHHRANAALAAAADAASHAVTPHTFLKAAEADVSRIEREGTPWGDAVALLIRAGVAATRGRRELAVVLLRSAESALEAVGMHLYAYAACRRHGELVGGAEGDALIDASDRSMAEQGIQVAQRFANMLAPGLWRARGSHD